MASPRTIKGEKRTWTDEMDGALKRHIMGGLSYKYVFIEINREFKTTVSRNAAIGRAHRLGLKNNSPKVVIPRVLAVRKRKLKPRRQPQQQQPPKIVTSFEALLECADLVPLHITFVDLEPQHCRYPFGEGPYTFCGHSQQDGRSYCASHSKLCGGVGTVSERNAAPMRGNRQSTRVSTRFGTFEAA